MQEQVSILPNNITKVIKDKIPLTIPNVMILLNKGKTVTEISKVHGCTSQAVSNFIKRHTTEKTF